MKILLVHDIRIPVFAYGGTERVIWDLAKGLIALGHEVSFLVPEGSSCDFAKVIFLDRSRPLIEQIPAKDFDIVHFQAPIDREPEFKYLVTIHGNSKRPIPYPLNTVFVSKDHALRHGSGEYVYNGLDWAAYGPVDWSAPRSHHHFLGKGAWPVKNLKGAIALARHAGVDLAVMGANRLGFSHSFRFTPWPSIHFYGMVGGNLKLQLLNQSKGMIFPVRWHEPFGLAAIESLYFGAPVFATPYGALPEIVTTECGYLSNSLSKLSDAIQVQTLDPLAAHHRAVNHFNHLAMARAYLEKYQRVLDGEPIHAVPPILENVSRTLLEWR